MNYARQKKKIISMNCDKRALKWCIPAIETMRPYFDDKR